MFLKKHELAVVTCGTGEMQVSGPHREQKGTNTHDMCPQEPSVTPKHGWGSSELPHTDVRGRGWSDMGWGTRLKNRGQDKVCGPVTVSQGWAPPGLRELWTQLFPIHVLHRSGPLTALFTPGSTLLGHWPDAAPADEDLHSKGRGERAW